jgi:hypothetical protein
MLKQIIGLWRISEREACHKALNLLKKKADIWSLPNASP